jgi:hypothetical protein
MRSLYESGNFCSLTYRDMPFVLAPNIWAAMSSRGQATMAAEERAHGDGINVDFDSPEALEEVFWRVFTGNEYLYKTCLKKYTPCKADREAFARYVSLIMKRYQRDRYLSKNNNNILRIHALRKTFPKAVILIPFRDPLHHAQSLFGQHQLFLQRHREDAFSRKYMAWLAHHEFGSEQKPFYFDPAYRNPYSPAELAYWLEQWRHVYSSLLDLHARDDSQVLFVGYEGLCDVASGLWDRLKKRVGIESDEPSVFELRQKPAVDADANVELVEKTRELYARLLEQMEKSLY